MSLDSKQLPSLTGLRSLTLGFVVTFCVSCEGATVPAVFILSGQSNMVGQGLSADLPDSLRTNPANVRFINRGAAKPLVEGETFGPEVTFAHAMSRFWPDREIYLVKYAVGATSLLAWAPDWDSSQAAVTHNALEGPLYGQLLETLSSASLPEGSELAAVLWMQGERDAFYPDAGRHYASNLVVLIQRLRGDLGVPALPFLYGRVNPPADRYPALAAVRLAQEETPARVAEVVMIDTDDLSKRDDEVHYDTDGLLELGRRFADAYVALLATEGGRSNRR